VREPVHRRATPVNGQSPPGAARRRPFVGVRRAVALLAVFLAAMVIMPALIFAHAALVSSSPAAGSRSPTSPETVRLVFSEPMEPNLGRVTLTGSDGRVVTLRVAGDPRDVHSIIATVPGTLAAGAYRVRWRVVSADGHPIGGTFSFGVGDSATVGVMPAATEEDVADESASAADSASSHDMPAGWGPSVAGAPLAPALLRGVAVGLLLATAGLLLFLTASSMSGTTTAARADAVARGAAILAVVTLALHFVAWSVHASPEHRLDGATIGAALGSGIGRIELWRTGLALLAVVALTLARRPGMALACVVGALLVSGATGHSAAVQPLWNTPAKAVHLLSAAVWLGGLLWLLLLDRADMARYASQAERVSSWALAAVASVTISGVIQTRINLPVWSDLVQTPYGLVTLAKVAGLAVLLAFGAHHKFRVVPKLRQAAAGGGGFAVTLRREALVMTVVILLGGLLGYLPTPGAPHAHTASTTQPSEP
jgi:copper transport protein